MNIMFAVHHLSQKGDKFIFYKLPWKVSYVDSYSGFEPPPKLKSCLFIIIWFKKQQIQATMNLMISNSIGPFLYSFLIFLNSFVNFEFWIVTTWTYLLHFARLDEDLIFVRVPPWRRFGRRSIFGQNIVLVLFLLVSV